MSFFCYYTTKLSFGVLGSFFSGGSFTFGSGSSLGFSLGSSFGLGSGLTLGGDSSSFGLVDFLLGFHTGFGLVASLILNVALGVGDLGLFGLLPFVVLHVSLLLGEGTFLDTHLEVAAEKNAFVGEDTTAGGARLGAEIGRAHV